MLRRPPRSTRTDTLFPSTTRLRSSDHGEVGAVFAELLEGLERPARLHVEEAGEHEDRQVVDIAAHAALPPPAVEGGVLEEGEAGVDHPAERVEDRSRRPLEASRSGLHRGCADAQDRKSTRLNSSH